MLCKQDGEAALLGLSSQGGDGVWVGVGNQAGASAVFLFPKATWVMERVVLIPPERFAGCCGCMENASVLARARRGLELCGADVV